MVNTVVLGWSWTSQNHGMVWGEGILQIISFQSHLPRAGTPFPISQVLQALPSLSLDTARDEADTAW